MVAWSGPAYAPARRWLSMSPTFRLMGCPALTGVVAGIYINIPLAETFTDLAGISRCVGQWWN